MKMSARMAKSETGTRKLILNSLRATIAAVFIAALAFSLSGHLGTLHRYFELASHFKPQYLVAVFVCLAAFLCLRAWRWAAAALVCALLNIWSLAPWFVGQPASASYEMRVLLSNVNAANTSYQALIDLIRVENPDVVVLQEAGRGWLQAMSVFSETYPFMRFAPNRDKAGIALMSRFPFEEEGDDGLGFPSIVARIRADGASVSIVSLHPPPPVTDELLDERNQQLQAAASAAMELPRPAILAGDLNTSVWSPYYARLVEESGLVSARKGFGIVPTWPTHMRLMMIPLDHCLVSKDVRVTNCRAAADIGSDHLPLIVDLVFASPPKD
jgi:endonuclease/exonuclease/phosphatase (EEP) superfamily protein YafD